MVVRRGSTVLVMVKIVIHRELAKVFGLLDVPAFTCNLQTVENVKLCKFQF